MTTSRRIARLVGPTLIVLTVSETINLDIWKTNNPAVTYLNGTVFFVAGLAIVRAHNRWLRSWPVVITLVGWLAIALGLFRMFAPRAQQGGENVPTYLVIATILAIGIFLTIKAYRPTRETGAVSGARVVPGAEGESTRGGRPTRTRQRAADTDARRMNTSERAAGIGDRRQGSSSGRGK
jgi:hypothetical protein